MLRTFLLINIIIAKLTKFMISNSRFHSSANLSPLSIPMLSILHNFTLKYGNGSSLWSTVVMDCIQNKMINLINYDHLVLCANPFITSGHPKKFLLKPFCPSTLLDTIIFKCLVSGESLIPKHIRRTLTVIISLVIKWL